MKEGINDRTGGLTQLVIAMLVFGSLWGLSEVALGGSLRATDFPYRSGLLTAIGLGIMGMGLVTTRQPLALLGIGLVAALVTQQSVPILHTSIMCKANSSLALIIEAGSLSLVAATVMRRTGTNAYSRVTGGVLAALVASTGFYFIGTHVAPCNYLLSFATPASFVVKEGLVWAGFTAFLLPLGCLAGEKLAATSLPALAGRSAAYYATMTGIVALAWGTSAVAIAAGL